MTSFFPGKEEKKVEYIELIYDLIFVYLIGRNNSLLHAIQDGFIQPGAFLTWGTASGPAGRRPISASTGPGP